MSVPEGRFDWRLERATGRGAFILNRSAVTADITRERFKGRLAGLSKMPALQRVRYTVLAFWRKTTG